MFAAIKGGIMNFSRSLSLSLAPEVRVNCMAPGWIKTSWGETASEYWQKKAKEECPLQRWGVPQDIASAARWLFSDKSSFVNGQTLAINGGVV
jgi:3-oxoacyl-[acyl-carrier protein] reductase